MFGAEEPAEQENRFIKRLGMYVVGQKGSVWLEDTDGRNMTDIINGDISILHAGCKVLRIVYENGDTELLSDEGNLFAKGYSCAKVLDFGDFYIIAAAQRDISPYDTEKNIYFTPDGERININGYLKNINEGKISEDSTDELDKRGRVDDLSADMNDYTEKAYEREYIKDLDVYNSLQYGRKCFAV